MVIIFVIIIHIISPNILFSLDFFFRSYDAPVTTYVTSSIHGKQNYYVYIVYETIHGLACCAYIQLKRFSMKF